MNTKALRQKILDLAIHGKLVPQNPNDESATVLLEKIRAEKAEKIKKGELKTDKKDSFIFTKECEFDEDKLGKCSSGTRHKRHYEQFADGTVKDIEDEIPFSIPEGWAWCRLKQLSLDMADGPFGSNLKAEHYTKNKEARIIQLSNIGEYGWREENTKFTTLEHAKNNISRSIVEPGNLVIAKMMPAGKAIICPNNEKMYVLSSDAVKLVPTSLINSNYLLNSINSPFFRASVTDNVQGTTRLRTSISKLRECFFPLPPFAEQERIVSSIERIFAQINNLEESKSNLESVIKQTKSKILDLAIHGKLVPQDPNDEPAEELLKRIATSDNRPYEKVDEEPFEIPDSWKWVKLNDLAEIARGGSPRPIQDYITKDKDGINWIKIGDTIAESKYITSAKEKIKPEGKKHSRFVHAGDFLLTNSMSFGRPYILKIDGCIHDGWLVFANIKECLLQDYLYYALSSAYIYETFSNVAAGSTVKNLKSDTVKQVDFPLPPLSEQKRIVEAIENMYEVLDQIQNNLV